MTSADVERFAKCIGEMCVAYSRPCDRTLIDVYAKVLADRRIEDVEAAAAAFMRTDAQFMPNPGALRKRAIDEAAKRHRVAFRIGSGWVSTRDFEPAQHPDALDAIADRAQLAAAPRRQLRAK